MLRRGKHRRPRLCLLGFFARLICASDEDLFRISGSNDVATVREAIDHKVALGSQLGLQRSLRLDRSPHRRRICPSCIRLRAARKDGMLGRLAYPRGTCRKNSDEIMTLPGECALVIAGKVGPGGRLQINQDPA